MRGASARRGSPQRGVDKAGVGSYNKGMKILVIDDEELLGKSIQRMLSIKGWEVTACCTADDGAEKVAEGGYDLVLLDFKMPEHDGIWFMKNATIPKGTKVLLMTAFVNRQTINDMFKLGVSGYVIKPFDEKELLKHLDFHSGGGADEGQPDQAAM